MPSDRKLSERIIENMSDGPAEPGTLRDYANRAAALEAEVTRLRVNDARYRALRDTFPGTPFGRMIATEHPVFADIDALADALRAGQPAPEPWAER